MFQRDLKDAIWGIGIYVLTIKFGRLGNTYNPFEEGTRGGYTAVGDDRSSGARKRREHHAKRTSYRSLEKSTTLCMA